MNSLAKPNDLVRCLLCDGTRISKHNGRECTACKTGYITREQRTALYRVGEDLCGLFLGLDVETLQLLTITDTELAT